jgi:hypothetical protein
LVPEGGQRGASEDVRDEEGYNEDADANNVDPGCDAETARYCARVETAVEKQNGDFDHSGGDYVEQIEGESDFPLRDVERRGYVPDVAVEMEVFRG